MDSTSAASAQLSNAVLIAVQKMTMDSMKTQGAQFNAMLGAVAAPRGSVNSPSQGTTLDAWA
jgi:hypothetical protein